MSNDSPMFCCPSSHLQPGDIVTIRKTGKVAIVGKLAKDGKWSVMDTTEDISYHAPADLGFVLRVPSPVPFQREIESSV